MAYDTTGQGRVTPVVTRGLESAWPLAVAVLVFAVVLIFAKEIGGFVSANTLDIGRVYSAFFDVAAILSGLLFGIYSLIKGTSSDFLRRISKSRAYAFMLSRAKLAMLASLIVTFYSIPVMLFEPALGQTTIQDVLAAAWCGAVVWMLALTYGTARLFMLAIDD